MRIAVIGLGLIGGSIGLAARDRLEAQTTGWDLDPSALAAAGARGAIDVQSRSIAQAVDGADAAFVAAPVGALPELVGEVLRRAPETCVVTDVGSTKRVVVDAQDDQRFVGGHPLAGAETSGIGHARADLFDGATWYLTPTTTTDGILYERLYRLLSSSGLGQARSMPPTTMRSWRSSRISRTCSPTSSSIRPRRRRGPIASGCLRPARASATRPGLPERTPPSGRTST